MAWTERLLHLLARRSSTEIDIQRDVNQVESLSSLTQTLDFVVTGRPTFVADQGITLELIDLDLEITRVIFSGDYDVTDAESQPQNAVIKAQGPLAKLRNARTGSDLLLTGMTDGEAIEAVLTACSITFDTADIQDAGYVLGEHSDLYWRLDEPGSSIVEELDNVLGMKTYEVTNGRIVRNAYDLAPSSTGAYRTFEKGVDTDLFSLHRTEGGADQIQSSWSVRGASVPCGPNDACTCTPWAMARSANPQLGSRRFRVQTQQFASDIIQSSELAEGIVRRMMRWYNRRPDTIALGTLTDANVHPTSVIGIIDATDYIDAEEPRYYTVANVDRSAFDMVLTGIGGAAGDEGTVTSGTEKICNTSEGSEDWDTGFTPPDTGFPPIDDGDPFTPDAPTSGWDETTPPVPPDTTSRFLDCTEVDLLMGVVDPGDLNAEDKAAWSVVEDSAWRTDFETAIGVHVTDGAIDELLLWSNRVFVLNLEPGLQASKNTGNDLIFDSPPIFTVEGEAWFRTESADQELRFTLTKTGGVLNAQVRIFPNPGFEHTTTNLPTNQTHHYNVGSQSENIAGIVNDSVSPGSCPNLTLKCNAGSWMGKGGTYFPANGAWYPFSISFDLTGTEQRIDVLAGSVDGYHEDPPCWGSTCQNDTGYSVTSFTNHRLEVRSVNLASGGDIGNPDAKIRLFKLFYDTCALNPDYVPPDRDEA